MAHSQSSKRWLKEHISDPYVKQAKQKGYRSRATFKLLELQKKHHLIKPNMNIIDLGAAPGGWSQIAAELLAEKGRIFALDILPMVPIDNVEFLQGDFLDNVIIDELLQKLGNNQINLILSDMAPNFSGIKTVDQNRVMNLAESALTFAQQVLSPGGNFLVKVFQGEGFDHYLKSLRKQFLRVKVCKPQSSRSRSKEIYLLGLNRIFHKLRSENVV